MMMIWNFQTPRFSGDFGRIPTGFFDVHGLLVTSAIPHGGPQPWATWDDGGGSMVVNEWPLNEAWFSWVGGSAFTFPCHKPWLPWKLMKTNVSLSQWLEDDSFPAEMAPLFWKDISIFGGLIVQIGTTFNETHSKLSRRKLKRIQTLPTLSDQTCRIKVWPGDFFTPWCFTAHTCHTVDGTNPKQPPGMYKNYVHNGISTTNLNWFARRISAPSNSISKDGHFWFSPPGGPPRKNQPTPFWALNLQVFFGTSGVV